MSENDNTTFCYLAYIAVRISDVEFYLSFVCKICQNRQTDGRTEGQTDGQKLNPCWSGVT